MPTADAFEWPQGQPLFEVMWRSVTESLAGNGIVNNGDLQVTATANALEIQVAAGDYFSLATTYTLGAAETHTLSAGDGTYDRWDTVYFDTGLGSSGVTEGTPAADPVPPDVTGDQQPLAFVYVAQNASDVAGSDILNWRATFSNEAEEVHYDDTTGTYGVSNVDAALDELQEAAQISAYPLALATDTEATAYPLALADLASPFALPDITDMDAAGNDITDSTAAVTIWDTSVPEVPQGVLGGPASSLTSYPLPNGDISNSSVTVNAGTGLTTNNATIALGGSATLNISSGGVTTTEIADGTILDADIDGTTTITRSKLDTTKTTTTTAASYTTSDEEVVFADSSGGAITITLASADATDGNEITVKDSTGSAGTNNITVDTGGETIDGSASVTLSTNWDSVTVVSDGTEWYTV